MKGMRFRLSRSLTFWLGLPGLLFLLWTWADSFDWQSRLGFAGKPGLGALASDGSTLSFEWTRYEPVPQGMAQEPLEYEIPELPSGMHFHFSHDPSARPKRPLLWAKFEAWTQRSGPTVSSAVFIPYWMITLGYLGLWSTALTWRWKRSRRTSAVDPLLRELGQRMVSP